MGDPFRKSFSVSKPRSEVRDTKKNVFFLFRLFITSPDCLTYLLLFRRMSGWVDLNNFFYLTHLPLHWIFLHAHYFRLSWPKNVFLVSRSFNAFPDFLTYLLLSRVVRLSWPKNIFSVSRLVDFRSGFWHWKWLPEGFARSSTSRKLCFLVCSLHDLWIGFWPQIGHPVEY